MQKKASNYFFNLIFGDGNWRQAEGWNLLLVGAIEVTAPAQGALCGDSLSSRGSNIKLSI